MKSIRKSTIVFASVIMLSLMVSIIFLGNRVEAKELENGGVSVEYKSVEEYYGKTAPTYQKGYVFAGWYEDEECSTAYVQKEGETLEGYYAKFVPESVLSVKAQNETSLLDTVLSDDATGQIRFVTSVDSLNYKVVGLHIEGKIGNTNLNKDYAISKVYTYLYATGTTEKEAEAKTAADTFGTPASKYFAAQAFKIRFDQFGDNFTVTPYWITPDGVRVEGVTRTRNMIDNLEDCSCAEVNKRAYYTCNDIFQIATTMNEAETREKIWVGEEPATMTVLKDVVISGQTSFDGTTTITNKAGAKVTIQTAETWNPNSKGACLLYTNGETLTIAGKSSEAGITIDGRELKTQIRNNSDFEASNVTFINGYRADNVGGAINADGSKNTIINNCAFKNNRANTNGGAIYVKTGSLQLTDSTFDGNYATTNHGGAIAFDTAAESSITNTVFYNNEAQKTSGGALYVTNTPLNVISCEFGKAGAPNKATQNGGAIYVTGANTVLNMTVDEKYTNRSLSYNTANSGGAIMVMNGTVDVTGYTFSHNQAANTGGAVRFYSDITKNVAMKSCNFDNNQAKTGGAVYIQAGTTIKGGTFESNIATTSGGAVYATGGTKATDIVNTEFYANNATTNGGALYLEKTTVNVESCAFGKKDSPNTAEVDGGAIYAGISGNLQMTVDNSQYSHKSLSYNTANSGGAIMTKGATVSVNGYTFDNNIAATFGGAIRHTKDTDTSANTLNVELCKFEKNTATATGGADNTGGGAISVEAETTVSNCDFKDNSTKRYGGAIVANAKLTVQGGSFDNNSASGRGGAISAAATLEVNGGTYTLNSCGGYGGAISQEKGIGTVNNVTFNSNIAKQAGGAVGCVGATLALTNCDFTNNKATDGTKTTTGGVACVTSGGKISILISDGTKRSFEGNTDSANRTLYAKAKSIIEYSSLYEGVASGTDGTGENIGKVTEITQ